MHFTELSGTARLFLVAIVCACGFGERLAVGNALFGELHFDFVDVFENPLQRAEMELTLSVHENLAQLLALFHHPRGVFLTQTREGGHHLFGVGFVDGTDGAGEFGVGVFDEVKAVVALFVVERVARAHVFQLHGAADVTGRKLFDLIAVGARAHKELCHAFFRPAVGVGEIVAFAHHTTHHLEILDFADVRFDARLEEVDAGGRFLVGADFLTASVVHLRHFVDEGNDVAQEFHEASHAHVLACADAEDGEDAAGDQSLADALAHFVFRELFGLKELLHESFVVFCCRFHEGFVHGLRLFELVGGDFLHDGFATFFLPREFFHENHVDEAVESRTGGEGILNGHHFGAVDVLQVVENQLIIAVFMVELIDEEDDRLAEFLGVAEVVLCSHLDTESTVEQKQRSVGNIEGRERSTDEIIGTRAVNQVEFLAFPLHMECS